jgi:hypothetical protein
MQMGNKEQGRGAHHSRERALRSELRERDRGWGAGARRLRGCVRRRAIGAMVGLNSDGYPN